MRPHYLILALALALITGCASSTKTAPPSTSTPAITARPTTTSGTAAPGALQAEANSAATGDIPDNQVFLTFRNARGGWSMKYPEGWAQNGAATQIAFRDKNNVVRVVVRRAATPTAASVRSELKGTHLQSGPQRISIKGTPAFKVVYSTVSTPNTVTGKRVTLVVDRYYLSHGSKEAVVDLGTPQGVDNVDAYRLMIESFRWR